jgi:hypothetical protein
LKGLNLNKIFYDLAEKVNRKLRFSLVAWTTKEGAEKTKEGEGTGRERGNYREGRD